MSLITFMSDFGRADHYVAAVKAKIVSANPSLQIIDISHFIKKYDIAHAAFVLKAIYKDFPSGTVHLVGVDSISYKGQKHVAMKLDEHYFVGPDNGIFSLISDNKPNVVVEILNKAPSTFPEKEIYASAVCFLASEQSIYDLGPELKELNKMLDRQLRVSDDKIVGNVVHVDEYGNLISNISKDTFKAIQAERNYSVSFAREAVNKITNLYSDVEEGDCVLTFNELGLLQISLNKGNAAELLGLSYDSPIAVTFS